jgi:hypothetical protein
MGSEKRWLSELAANPKARGWLEHKDVAAAGEMMLALEPVSENTKV